MTVAIGADKHRAAKGAARGQTVQTESGPKRNTACENTFAINFAKLKQMHARKELCVRHTMIRSTELRLLQLKCTLNHVHIKR